MAVDRKKMGKLQYWRAKERLPHGQRGSLVEMAGVEPASEEKTIQTTTYVVCLSFLVPPNPTDRILEEPT